jgi:hypothetical protein
MRFANKLRTSAARLLLVALLLAIGVSSIGIPPSRAYASGCTFEYILNTGVSGAERLALRSTNSCTIADTSYGDVVINPGEVYTLEQETAWIFANPGRAWRIEFDNESGAGSPYIVLPTPPAGERIGQATATNVSAFTNWNTANPPPPGSWTPVTPPEIPDPEEAEPQTCEQRSPGLFGFFTCFMLRGVTSVASFVTNVLYTLLETPSEYINSPAVREVWQNFRDIALIMLVPAMLLMTLGTALGFEWVSAYTVKKALPRMVIAAIFIVLSYDITIFFVNFINVIGAGILGPTRWCNRGWQLRTVQLESLFNRGGDGS